MISVVINYVGDGMFQDSKAEMWRKSDTNNVVKSTRTYGPYEDMDHFNTDRPDLAFMVGYKAMTAVSVADSGVAPVVNEPTIPEPVAKVIPDPESEPEQESDADIGPLLEEPETDGVPEHEEVVDQEEEEPEPKHMKGKIGRKSKE